MVKDGGCGSLESTEAVCPVSVIPGGSRGRGPGWTVGVRLWLVWVSE